MTIVFNGTTGITTPSDLINQDTLGYTTGAGGTVTQLTSKGTEVTLNKPSGQITMNNAALASNTTVAFTVTNSTVSANDSIIFTLVSGFTNAGNYLLYPQTNAGSFIVLLRNISVGSLSEAIVFNFAVIKGATS